MYFSKYLFVNKIFINQFKLHVTFKTKYNYFFDINILIKD
jgi:hypothetical protein